MAVVVAQLVEGSLPTPGIRNSNPDIGKTLSTNCTFIYPERKEENNEMAHLKKNIDHCSFLAAHTELCEEAVCPFWYLLVETV